MSSEQDIHFMQRVLELARKGAGFVSPNPMAGCVIVRDDEIIAEGYHKKYGGPHAEIDALRKMQNAPARLASQGEAGGECRMQNCTVYVNLEPCCAYPDKKTPPCVDALIAAGVKRVVVGMKDPNPLVAGKGIRHLRQAGIEVKVGVLVHECRVLNEIFTKWIITGRPFVLLKIALTLDGALAFRRGVETPLGSKPSMVRVQALRQQYDAIVVGVNTVLIDNPRLTSRGRGRRHHPVRIILDTHFRVPERARVFSEPGKTIICVGPIYNHFKQKRLVRQYQNVDVVSFPHDRYGHVSAVHVLSYLHKEGMSSVLIEGGSDVARSFLRERLVDTLILIYTPHLATHRNAPRLWPEAKLDPLVFTNTHWETVGDDAWFAGYLKRQK